MSDTVPRVLASALAAIVTVACAPARPSPEFQASIDPPDVHADISSARDERTARVPALVPGSIDVRHEIDGTHLRFDGHFARVRAVGVGREEAILALEATGLPLRDGARTRQPLNHEVDEWWHERAEGLEHGFDVRRRPPGSGELVIEIEMAGAFDLSSRGTEVALRAHAGRAVATYGGLHVVDARGATLPARFDVDRDRVRIIVADEDAAYPIVVDPLFATAVARLFSVGGDDDYNLSESVAISGDGRLVLAGQPAASTSVGGLNAGNAIVFLRTATGWVEDVALLPSTNSSGDRTGLSVALSADGLRAVVGSPNDDPATVSSAGSAAVFVRTSGVWLEEATLIASDGATFDLFGYDVALDSDGMRAVVGALEDDVGSTLNAGSARVFVRSGTSWTEEATLTATTLSANDYLGISVAISGAGDRAAVGAYRDDTAGGGDAGSVHVFSRSGTVWTEEAMLVASDGLALDWFGRGLAIDEAGDTLVVGAPNDDTPGGISSGSAHVFSRVGTAWAETAMLLPSDGGPGSLFGFSVSTSGDGSTVLAGAYGHDDARGEAVGSAYLFVAGSPWTEDAILLASPGAAYDLFGANVAITPDAATAVISTEQADTPYGISAGQAVVFDIRPTSSAGTACVLSTECTSGHCVDGICCTTACAGGTSDCQACSVSAGGTTDGTCTPLTDARAAATICRAAAGPCDLPDACLGGVSACPVDSFASVAVLCRAAVGPCDAEEHCNGTMANCPGDALVSAGTSCRASAGPCDAPEACDGSATACPGDVLLPAGVVCRSTSGLCDIEDLCTGLSAGCPADVVVGPGIVCRPPASACDVAESCTGLLPQCPPDLFAAATVTCGPAATDVCDSADHCSGTSPDCVDTYLAGIECRPSAGACDSPEICSGSSAACPADAVEPAGMACRPSSRPECDPQEVCDGASAACPADVTDCEDPPDAGPRDAGVAGTDATAADGGGTGVARTVCSCRTHDRRIRVKSLGACLLLLASLALARRGGRRPTSR